MTRHGLRSGIVGGACVVVLAMASGCASNRADDVQSVASQFYDAISAEHGSGACALLAPPTRSSVEQTEKKPCPDAIMAAGLHPPSRVEKVKVYGTMAQVTWGTEVTFLTRYDEGWRVLAAGCSMPPASQRTADHYDCTVEAG
ncbi:MAG TPA: hypothetical protein VGK78_07960 [Nocardioides sp.]|uniref:hypothetical protein n=1 Tax=Nocardioides sp. TaxID=35761 RepID=UPI002F42E396